jgi:hypothetical protein
MAPRSALDPFESQDLFFAYALLEAVIFLLLLRLLDLYERKPFHRLGEFLASIRWDSKGSPARHRPLGSPGRPRRVPLGHLHLLLGPGELGAQISNPRPSAQLEGERESGLISKQEEGRCAERALLVERCAQILRGCPLLVISRTAGAQRKCEPGDG